MEILKSAVAGTLESSDAMVTVEPGEGIELSVSSSVMNQYGRQIKATVLETLFNGDTINRKWLYCRARGTFCLCGIIASPKGS